MTAANSTPLSDGASAVLLASEEWAKERDLPVLAYFVDGQTAAVDHVHKREGLLMAPAYAMPRMLDRIGLRPQDFDLYEIHEAFAAQVLCTLQAWEDPAFCRDRLGREQPLGSIDREQAQRQRRLARRRPPLRRDRRAHRRQPRQGPARARLGPRPDQHLRGRRPGRRRRARKHGRGQVSDLYTQVVNSPPGRMIAGRVGLPQPAQLERHEPGAPVVSGRRARRRRPAAAGSASAIERAARRRSAPPRPETVRRARSRRSSSTPPASPTRPSWSSCSASSTPT